MYTITSENNNKSTIIVYGAFELCWRGRKTLLHPSIGLLSFSFEKTCE